MPCTAQVNGGAQLRRCAPAHSSGVADLCDGVPACGLATRTEGRPGVERSGVVTRDNFGAGTQGGLEATGVEGSTATATGAGRQGMQQQRLSRWPAMGMQEQRQAPACLTAVA